MHEGFLVDLWGVGCTMPGLQHEGLISHAIVQTLGAGNNGTGLDISRDVRSIPSSVELANYL